MKRIIYNIKDELLTSNFKLPRKYNLKIGNYLFKDQLLSDDDKYNFQYYEDSFIGQNVYYPSVSAKIKSDRNYFSLKFPMNYQQIMLIDAKNRAKQQAALVSPKAISYYTNEKTKTNFFYFDYTTLKNRPLMDIMSCSEISRFLQNKHYPSVFLDQYYRCNPEYDIETRLRTGTFYERAIDDILQKTPNINAAREIFINRYLSGKVFNFDSIEPDVEFFTMLGNSNIDKSLRKSLFEWDRKENTGVFFIRQYLDPKEKSATQIPKDIQKAMGIKEVTKAKEESITDIKISSEMQGLIIDELLQVEKDLANLSDEEERSEKQDDLALVEKIVLTRKYIGKLKNTNIHGQRAKFDLKYLSKFAESFNPNAKTDLLDELTKKEISANSAMVSKILTNLAQDDFDFIQQRVILMTNDCKILKLVSSKPSSDEIKGLADNKMTQLKCS